MTVVAQLWQYCSDISLIEEVREQDDYHHADSEIKLMSESHGRLCMYLKIEEPLFKYVTFLLCYLDVEDK